MDWRRPKCSALNLRPVFGPIKKAPSPLQPRRLVFHLVPHRQRFWMRRSVGVWNRRYTPAAYPYRLPRSAAFWCDGPCRGCVCAAASRVASESSYARFSRQLRRRPQRRRAHIDRLRRFCWGGRALRGWSRIAGTGKASFSSGAWCRLSDRVLGGEIRRPLISNFRILYF